MIIQMILSRPVSLRALDISTFDQLRLPSAINEQVLIVAIFRQNREKLLNAEVTTTVG